MDDSRSDSVIVPDMLIIGYRHGFFPMADADTHEVLWHRPDPRAIIPLDGVTISKSLRKVIQRHVFSVTIDTAFSDVIHACAQRDDTWISPEIVDAYIGLHELGIAHSIETWRNGKLVGGLYGVHIGAAFFGESMFSVESDASKVAFAHLVAILRANGFRLLDTQYINPFTASLGAIEVSDAVYQILLADAVDHDVPFRSDLTG
ncbi:MAG: leucyl/phenylalanyl-tRNA--protein transferase [Candidatus Kapabacteria bacterium]|nr:leucyl/phenylalanyl-tRNA--protein transferase [Candidatus Kapabacteria bacterium]